MERKKYPVEQKLKIVQECLETGNCAVVARRYGLSSSMVNRWTRNYCRYGEAAFTGNSSKTSKGSQGINSHLKELKETITENEKLKKLLGEKELEIEILKDLLKKTNPHLQIK